MVIRGPGGDSILEEYYTWPMELLAVVNMLHMFAYGHHLVGAYGHGVIMSPWFALLESVAMALPKALWH